MWGLWRSKDTIKNNFDLFVENALFSSSENLGGCAPPVLPLVISITLLKSPFFVCVSGVHNVDAAEEADGGLGEPGSEEDEEEYDSGGSGVALTPPDSPSPIDAAAQAAAANQGDKSRRIICNSSCT